MALKVVISLPNNVSITIEANDPPSYQEVISTVLKELPRELAQLPLSSPPNSGEAEKDNNPEAVQSSEKEAQPLVQSERVQGTRRDQTGRSWSFVKPSPQWVICGV